MKKALFLALSALALSPLSAISAEIPADSRVTKVTVYQDRALVTRFAEVKLAPGANAVAFEGLPASIMEDSLRAEGKGTAPVTIEGAEVKRHFLIEEADENVKRIQAEIEMLQEEQRGLQEKSEALQSERTFLDNIRNFTSQQTAEDLKTKSSTAEEWATHAAFLRDSYDKNGQARLALEKQMRDVQERIDAKHRELSGTGGPGDREKKTVLVGVNAKEAATLRLELHYIVPAATWSVSYDAKVDPDKKQCALVSYGNVRQWSGEEWKDVTLVLSSAKPAVGGRMPELDPWYVDFYRAPQPVRPMMARMAAKPAMMEDRVEMDSMSAGAVAPEANFAEAEVAQAEVAQDLGVVTFTVSRPFTVLADNRLYKTPVQTETFPTSLDYRATPKLSPYAFLHSEVTNDKDYVIAGGEMNVFVKDSYVGKSFVKTTGRGEKFDLYLGIDEEVKVKRVELKEKRKKALLGLRSRKDYGYRLEVENYKKEAVKVGLSDQLPVSRNAEIKVELVSAEPAPTGQDAEKKAQGILYWELDIPAAAKKAVEFAFFVEHPADKEVPGV